MHKYLGLVSFGIFVHLDKLFMLTSKAHMHLDKLFLFDFNNSTTILFCLITCGILFFFNSPVPLILDGSVTSNVS